MKQRYIRACVVGTLGLWAAWAATPCLAQLSNLDKITFIEGLRREGMGELLKHLVEVDPPQDPVLARQIAINVDLLEYTEKGKKAGQESDPAQAVKLRGEAVQAFERGLDGRRKLIADFRDHEQRPLWQTDLAESLQLESLLSINDDGAEFYELGVPTEAQRQAFEKIVPEAVTELLDADRRFFDLQGDLPRRRDFKEKFENTGLFARMMDDYYRLRTKYFLAHFAYYATLLPDSNPYFATLAKDPRIGSLQKKRPADERARLLALAIDSVEKEVKDPADTHEIRRQCLSLTGRALLAQGNFNDAIAMFDQVLQTKQGDLTELTAALAKAAALDKSKRRDQALDLLTTLQNVAPAKGNLLYRLLVVDQTHLILKAAAEAAPAEKRTEALAASYEVYLKFINDPAMAQVADGLKTYIYKRWESSIPPGANMADLPDAVVAAVGEMSRSAGQTILDEADAQPDAKLAEKIRGQGKAKLERAVLVNGDLLKRTTLSPSVRAQAMFNLAVSTFFLDTNNIENRTKAAVMLTEMADQYPDQPASESSIGDAVRLLRSIFDLPARPAGITEQYEKAVKVLLSKFPATKAADAERLPYTNDVLIPADRWADAAAVLKQISGGNTDYWPAQKLLIYCQQQAYRKATEGKDQAAQAVLEEGQRIIQESEGALRSESNPAGQKAIREAVGWAKLVLADMAIDHEKDLAKALELLKNFDQEFAGETLLIRLMLEKRIVCLLKVDRIDNAVNEGQIMMRDFPDDAAPVIDQVISALDQQMDELKVKIGAELVERAKQELQTLLTHKAEAAVKMARMLRDWSHDPKRGYTEDQFLPFDLIYVKSLRMAGSNKDALAIAEALVAKYPDSAPAIFNEAEARYALGGQDNLVKAAPLYDKIITRVRPEGSRYPAIWWNAWLRRLQINDVLNVGTKDIPLRVRELKSKDPNLGGDAFKISFNALEQKWSTK